MPTVELRFSAVPAHVRTARLIASTVGRRSGLDESLVDEVRLAVGEACARAVGVQQAHGVTEEVVVTFADDEGTFAVTVADHGQAEAEADLADLIDAAAGLDGTLPIGFGLAVIAGLVDDLEVTSNGDGTVVRMCWPLLVPSSSS
ncbi:MAG TPA: ATP-binding protein [Mycobacteriales bacterium]|nr:ATP-binding protein [Mycobacteriales bacterium]